MATKRRHPPGRLLQAAEQHVHRASRAGSRTASGTLPRVQSPAEPSSSTVDRTRSGTLPVMLEPEPATAGDAEAAMDGERNQSMPEMQEPHPYDDRLLGGGRKQSGTLPIVGESRLRRARADATRDAALQKSLEPAAPTTPHPKPRAGAASLGASQSLPWAPVARSRRPENVGAQPAAFALAAVGVGLCALFVAQALKSVEWPWLSEWQRDEAYKLWTGVALTLFVAAQWFLSIARVRGWNKLARELYVWHQRSGVLAPLALFAHSTQLGFGYLVLLSAVFLGNTLLGLLSPRAFPKLRNYAGVWLSGHIALSVTLAVLAAYHAWIALYFE